ncbi:MULTISPECIES: hypothetical protein [Streptomyces]|uniref:hypothetical protein n=1 Tax=Streptomyces TaxID=1883 RepID=UPI000AEA540D|nr:MULTISPECIES: hypothetical protein [Streptomyces]
MTARFEPVVVRPLPRPLKPFPHETESSFLSRLAAANATPVQRLQRPSLWLTSRLDPIDQLSVLSGQSRTTIQYAIPRWENKSWNVSNGPLALTPRWACRRCVARRTGNPQQDVMVWMSKHHDQVCIPHRLWIGRAVDSAARQYDLADLPEVVQAQRRHYRNHRPSPVRTSLNAGMQNSVITASGALLAALIGLSGALWATISNQRKQQQAQRDAWKKDGQRTSHPLLLVPGRH